MGTLPRITDTERSRVFGPSCTPANLRTYLTPWGLRVQVHFLVAPVFAAACALAKRSSSWTPLRADSYACRPIRGSTATSLHAWGLAVDWFATPPTVEPPGGVWTPDNAVPAAFAAAFEWYGFTWGANFTRRDVPHIEWAAGRPAPVPAPEPVPPAPVQIPDTEEDAMFLAWDPNAAWLVYPAPTPCGLMRRGVNGPGEAAAWEAARQSGKRIVAPAFLAGIPVAP